MAEQSKTTTLPRRGLTLRDVNGLFFVLLALGITMAFATLTEANYRAEDARVAAEQAEQVRLAKAEEDARRAALKRQIALVNTELAGKSSAFRKAGNPLCSYGSHSASGISS